MSSKPYFVYLLECDDGTIYTGITTDLDRRLAEHRNGTGAHYTRAHGVSKIAYSEKHPDRSTASKREAEIKKLTRSKKISLIKTRVSNH